MFFFLFKKTSITQILSRLVMKEAAVTHEGLKPQIYIDRCEPKPDIEQIEEHISSISRTLFVDTVDSDADHESTKERIQFELDNLLSKIAYSTYEQSLERLKIIDTLKDGRQFGVMHMAYYIFNSLNKLASAKIISDKIFRKVEYDSKEAQALLHSHYPKFREMRLSQFRFNDEIPDKEANILISFTIDMIPQFTKTHVVDDADVVTMVMFIAVLKGFKHRFDLDHEFYTGCSNIIDVLNNSAKFQKARDLSEEMLVIAIEENKHYYGWDILFRCYNHQKIIYDASIYGALLIRSISDQSEVPYSIIVDTLYNAMRFFRNFKYYEFAFNVYKSLKAAKLEEYDDQKITLTYFNTFLLGPMEKHPEFIPEIFKYVEEHNSKIKHFGYQGLMPWLALLEIFFVLGKEKLTTCL